MQARAWERSKGAVLHKRRARVVARCSRSGPTDRIMYRPELTLTLISSTVPIPSNPNRLDTAAACLFSKRRGRSRLRTPSPSEMSDAAASKSPKVASRYRMSASTMPEIKRIADEAIAATRRNTNASAIRSRSPTDSRKPPYLCSSTRVGTVASSNSASRKG